MRMRKRSQNCGFPDTHPSKHTQYSITFCMKKQSTPVDFHHFLQTLFITIFTQKAASWLNLANPVENVSQIENKATA
ncbi:hypothetical protein [Lacticaseibacillus suilingensis]|jgi:hypothetical protein